MLGAATYAAEPPLAGRPLEAAIRQIEAHGVAVIYSTDLVTPDLRVIAEPRSTEPVAMLAEVLAPHSLALSPGPNGRLMIVRAQAAGPQKGSGPRPVALREIVVTASRYRFANRALDGSTALTAQQLGMLPEIGEDPIRAVSRLPGTASQDFSSKPYIRGGIADETLVRFDGLRLYNPYHLKDFQNLFSTIDTGIVDQLTVYTAGFPVTYGDRMSGVVDISPVRPGSDFGGRVSLSVFNLAALLGGPVNGGRGEWLAAARRGNLDLVLDAVDPDLGRPAYTDAYARFAYTPTPDLKVSANLLIFDDDLEVFDSDQEEEARAKYRDEYYWAALDWDQGKDLGVRGQVAHTLLSSERTGTADLPGVGSGSLEDRRQFTIDTAAVDGWWSPRPAWDFRAGMEWRAVEGRYAYADEARFDLLFLGVDAAHEPRRERRLALRPQGHHYAAYASWRLEATDQLAADLGLRWDRETLSPGGSEALAPRLGLFWQPVPGTRLRASWGQFFQAQGIDEAAVSDGDPGFYRGQKAEHSVVGVEHRISDSFDLRIEAYRKQYADLHPRYENMLNPLVVLPELKPDRIRIDPRSARADGIELTLSFERGSTSGWLNYVWSSVEDRVVDRNAPRTWDQTHFVGLGASYKGDLWDITLAASWHSGWPTTALELMALNPVPLVQAGPRNAARLDSYLRLDAHVARRFELSARHRLTVFLDVNNLGNRRNECCVEYQIETDAPEPYLDVGPLESLPIVPSLGVIWEF